ncbi:MAG: VOC family protein [Saprospiraceae bacterium]|nr:VOC family protein [Saprospiraceae bacterium]
MIRFSHTSPILPVSDMERTLKFYRDVLEFDTIWRWDQPTTIANAGRPDCKMLFKLSKEEHLRTQGLEIMVFLHGVKPFWDSIKDKDLLIIDEIETKPWGLTEFCVKDINGYLLRFAETLSEVKDERIPP